MAQATTYLAIAFFVISLVLGNLTANRVKATDEWNNIDTPAGQVAPATDAIPTDSVEPKANNTDVPSSDVATEKDSDVPG